MHRRKFSYDMCFTGPANRIDRFCAALASKTFSSLVRFLELAPPPLDPFSPLEVTFGAGLVPNLLVSFSIRDFDASLSSSTWVQNASFVNF